MVRYIVKIDDHYSGYNSHGDDDEHDDDVSQLEDNSEQETEDNSNDEDDDSECYVNHCKLTSSGGGFQLTQPPLGWVFSKNKSTKEEKSTTNPTVVEEKHTTGFEPEKAEEKEEAMEENPGKDQEVEETSPEKEDIKSNRCYPIMTLQNLASVQLPLEPKTPKKRLKHKSFEEVNDVLIENWTQEDYCQAQL